MIFSILQFILSLILVVCAVAFTIGQVLLGRGLESFVGVVLTVIVAGFVYSAGAELAESIRHIRE